MSSNYVPGTNLFGRAIRGRASGGYTTSQVSFSGADYKAVVFMPMDPTALTDEIRRLQSEQRLAQSEQEEKEAAWSFYSELIVEATTWAQFNWNAAEAYNKVGDYHNEALARKRYTEYQFDRQIAIRERDKNGGTPSQRFQLEKELKAYAAEVKRLQAALAKGESYSRAITLGDVQTITWSTFREKKPVRTFGRVNPKARTRGNRTIAGSLIFTVFNKASLWDLLQAQTALANTGVKIQGGAYPSTEGVLVDQLPPFDISIIASNEVGDSSSMVLYGVEIHSEGTTLSIQDMMTECVMQFSAVDIDVLRPLGERRLLEEPGKIDPYQDATTLLSNSLSRRHARVDPFI